MRIEWRGATWRLATLALLLLPAGVSRAGDTHGSPGAPSGAEQICSEAAQPTGGNAAFQAFPGSAGMRIFLDPETGRLIGPDQLPPQALSALEMAMLRRDTRGLTQRTLANGAVVVDLQGRFQSFAIATLQPRGDVSTSRCVAAAVSAEALLEGELTARGASGEACHAE